MKIKGINRLSILLLTILSCVMAGSLTSCHAVWEDEPECPQGLSVRFVYDYNMEYANAFMSQVHCLTVFVYDEQGHLVKTVTETDRAKLSDENWRMNIDLPEGTYQVVAYGGMACPDASFEFEGSNTENTDRRVALIPSLLTDPVGPNLHPLFYGELKRPGSTDEPELPTVGYNDADYQQVTVYMMKDTNNLRILLHHVDGAPVEADDFDFYITDNNTLFNYDNSLLPSPEVTYWPWTKGNVNTDFSDRPALTRADDDTPSFAFAEISTSRFVTDSAAKLVIKESETGREVLSIPLVKYLMMYKSENIARMTYQEFLDRKSEWELTFLLDKNSAGWFTVSVRIENWVVRINDIEK